MRFAEELSREQARVQGMRFRSRVYELARGYGWPGIVIDCTSGNSTVAAAYSRILKAREILSHPVSGRN